MDIASQNIRDAIIRLTPADGLEYERLVAKLPEEERLVWRLIGGDFEPSNFATPALITKLTVAAFDCLRLVSGKPIACWPTIPPTEADTMRADGKAGASSLYSVDEAENVYRRWDTFQNQWLLDGWADSFPPPFLWNTVTSSNVDVAVLKADLPREKCPPVTAERRILMSEWLKQVALAASHVGWAATQVGNEPAMLLVFQGNSEGAFIKNVAAAMNVRHLEYAEIRQYGDTVRLAAFESASGLFCSGTRK